DLAGKPDAKKNYPPREHAEAALAEMPLKPSFLVATGGGLHAYWLLNEPLDVWEAQRVHTVETEPTEPWHGLMRAKLAKYGQYAVDSTHDLTRTLRVVGTVRDNGHVVDVLPENDCVNWLARYSREDFDPYVQIWLREQHAASRGGQKSFLDPRT